MGEGAIGSCNWKTRCRARGSGVLSDRVSPLDALTGERNVEKPAHSRSVRMCTLRAETRAPKRQPVRIISAKTQFHAILKAHWLPNGPLLATVLGHRRKDLRHLRMAHYLQ